MATSKRYALVTGCSEGGLGWYIAREFANRGIHTFATVRTLSKAGDLASVANIEILELDVTSTESIKSCVKVVNEKTGGKLNFLYNNAGALLVMPIADQDLAAAKRNFDVNVWSIVEVTQNFLPLLVAAKGHLVNAGSTRAFVYLEFDAVYAMTKASISKLSENMRIEFAPLGVKVSCIQIGAIATKIFEKQPTYDSLKLPENSYYKSIQPQIQSIAYGNKIEKLSPSDPADFARDVVKDILAGKTGEIWRGKYSTITRILRLFPSWIHELLLGPESGLPALAKEMKHGKKDE